LFQALDCEGWNTNSTAKADARQFAALHCGIDGAA